MGVEQWFNVGENRES